MRKIMFFMLVLILACCGGRMDVKVLQSENWKEKKHLDYRLFPQKNLIVYSLVYKGSLEKEEAQGELFRKAEWYQGEMVKKIFQEQLESLRMDERKENISAWNEVVNEVKVYALEKYNEELEGAVKSFKERKLSFLAQQVTDQGFQKVLIKGEEKPALFYYLEWSLAYGDYQRLRDEFLLERINIAPNDRIKLFKKRIYEDAKGL